MTPPRKLPRIVLRLDDVVEAVMEADGDTNKRIAVKLYRNTVLEAAAEEGEKWARSMNIDAMIAKTCGDRIRKLKAEA